MIGWGLAWIMCLGALLGLALTGPSAWRSRHVAPPYYNLARVALPVLTLAFFGPRAFGLDFPGRSWAALVFLPALSLVVLGILIYLYREPGATLRREAAIRPPGRQGELNLLVRAAEPDDLPGIGRVFAHAFHLNFDLDFGPDRERNAQLLAELLAFKLAELEVAVEAGSGQVVGALWLDLGRSNSSARAEARPVEVNFRRGWPVLQKYLNPLHAFYYASIALPAIMARRGTAGEGYIQWLGVDPDYQGYGSGRQLVERAVELSRAAGKARLVLHTERSNRRARRLYESAGFKPDAGFSIGPRLRYVKDLR